MRFALFLALGVFISASTACPARASQMSDGLADMSFESSDYVMDFDWPIVWGTVDTLGQDDFVIPSSQLPAKADIKELLRSCISDKGKMDQAKLKAHLVDFNGDDVHDILLDGHSFYQAYSETSLSCNARLCTDEEGCFVSLYVVGDAHQIGYSAQHDGRDAASASMLQAKLRNCPDHPEDNAQCLAGCPATEEACPALFTYDMRRVWHARAKRGTFVSAEDFLSLAQGQGAYVTRNIDPVLALEHGGKDMALCGADELAAHGGRCVKYYQFVGSNEDGAFVDLHVAPVVVSECADCSSFDRPNATGAVFTFETP